MTATVDIRGRKCWLIRATSWDGKPLFQAATIWSHNRDYVHTTTGYDYSMEDAFLRLYDEIRQGIA